MGDFNADPSKGRFWPLLKDFCFSLSLHIVHEHLSTDTFTYLCPSKNTTSWLDHVICSSNISENISSVYIDYNSALYDHFPLCVNINFPLQTLPVTDNIRIISEFVNWNKMSTDNKEHIKHFIDDQIASRNLLDSHTLSCYDVNCKNDYHCKELIELFNSIKDILIQSTENFKFAHSNKFKIIPGWNDHVKHFHDVARTCFLLWKEKGRPLQGKLLDDMKVSRADFRIALKFCRDNERDIRNPKLLENLRNKNFKVFWCEVGKVDKHNAPQPTEIDGLSKNKDIANLFSSKYSAVFNKSKQSRKVTGLSPKMKVEALIRLSNDDIKKGIKQLKDSIGFDCIHSNHLKISSDLLHELLAQLYTSFLVHGFVPAEMIRGVITPVIKDKFGDISSSSNYRPIMNSSVFLKLFEYCLLDRIDPYISLDDRQHGFRSNYSTSTACYTLKETTLFYTQANSNVYACFVDISKAFDSVNHDILFHKLSCLGIPTSVIKIMKFWYANQFASVRYHNSMSHQFQINNGVRQGGVLSGLLFNVYIDSLISNVSKLKVGCRLGLIRSNIIAYADDIVLLAPSMDSLKVLVDTAYLEATRLHLEFNFDKTKLMKFHSCSERTVIHLPNPIDVNNNLIYPVTSYKYLGYFVSDNLNYSDDTTRVKRKFYSEFNSVLRKFSFSAKNFKLYLFKQYCLQFYGSELWFGPFKSLQVMRQFEVGYHKAIKKLLGLSTHESNHYACQEASLLMLGSH